MKRVVFAVAVFLGPLAATGPAQAYCDCQCVNGLIKAVCSSSYESRPSCPAKPCSGPSAAQKSYDANTGPPVGTGAPRCQQRYVMNPDTRRWEWQDICR